MNARQFGQHSRQALWGGNIVFVSLLAMTLAAKADVQIKRDGDSAISVWVTGIITEQDAKSVQDISGQLENPSVLNFWLDSKGGDVSAAIKIGRLIRRYDGQTLIAQNGKCYSSCALIFIAGVRRVNFGELGLHRPYLASAPQSRETVEKQVPLMLSMIKSYVAEMGVTDNFYQEMVNTDPSQMLIYWGYDYKKLVPETDPVYAEIETARDARQYGITTSEMRQREQDTKSCDRFISTDISRWNLCTEAVRWGLSERVYRERQAKLLDGGVCKISEEERETWEKTPRRLRSALPLVVRFETCKRDIMLGVERILK